MRNLKESSVDTNQATRSSRSMLQEWTSSFLALRLATKSSTTIVRFSSACEMTTQESFQMLKGHHQNQLKAHKDVVTLMRRHSMVETRSYSIVDADSVISACEILLGNRRYYMTRTRLKDSFVWYIRIKSGRLRYLLSSFRQFLQFWSALFAGIFTRPTVLTSQVHQIVNN
jgi:hypothetical protein